MKPVGSGLVGVVNLNGGRHVPSGQYCWKAERIALSSILGDLTYIRARPRSLVMTLALFIYRNHALIMVFVGLSLFRDTHERFER